MYELSLFQNYNKVFTKSGILYLFDQLNGHLKARNVKSEICLVGDAVMCLCSDSRQSTLDLDVVFKPNQVVYDCAKAVAYENDLNDDWLNNVVKEFLNTKSDFIEFRKFSNLTVKVASPDYMFALKLKSCRTDRKSDIDDLKFLVNLLRIRSLDDAKEIVKVFFKLKLIPNKSWYFLEELLEDENI